MSASLLPEDVRKKLASDPFGVEMTDEQGDRVAVLVSPDAHQKMLNALAKTLFTEEELNRKVDPNEPSFPLAEILADLEKRCASK